MIKTRFSMILLFLLTAGIFTSFSSSAVSSEKTDTSNVSLFIRKELNTGMFLSVSKEREELSTDESTSQEDILLGTGGFRIENRVWNYLSYKQEFFNLTLYIGPFYGRGNWLDTTTVSSVDGKHSSAGVRAKLNAGYVNRFYYDNRNFTLVEINGWGRNDFYYQNQDGVRIDSANVSSDFNNEGFTNKLRYGFQAKAGWGYGKLNPVNHYMTADYIFSEYYEGRVFSEVEIEKLAAKISEIKHRRDPSIERSPEKEVDEIKEYLRTTMLLLAPDITAREWELGEFTPRLQGRRIEFGPFFNYYNQEPDFYYGGFVNYDCGKYINSKWNRNLNANLRYNSYKHHDWATFETNLGWSYYAGLKSKYTFGLKYIPGIVIRDWDEMEPVQHNFIPYVEYYTQVNAKTRMNFSFAWKIGDGENFMLSGPEFSLVIYQSRY